MELDDDWKQQPSLDGGLLLGQLSNYLDGSSSADTGANTSRSRTGIRRRRADRLLSSHYPTRQSI